MMSAGAPFSTLARRATAPILEGILAQPFIIELSEGVLTRERFVRYLQQDALYLLDYSRALLALAAAAPSGAARQALAGFATGALEVERVLHGQYLSGFGAGAAPAMGQACLAYTSFLLARTHAAPYGVGLAAVLPCFKIYADVGEAIYGQVEREGRLEAHPYREWLGTYSDPHFATLTQQALALGDEAYAHADQTTRQAMLEAYLTGARLEDWFWADAYGPAWPC